MNEDELSLFVSPYLIKLAKTKKCKYCHIDLDEININVEKIAKRIVKEISGSKQNDKASNSSP